MSKSVSHELNTAREQIGKFQEKLKIQQEILSKSKKKGDEEIDQLKIENVGMKELNNSISTELVNAKELLDSKEQIYLQLIAENEVILNEKLDMIKEMEEKLDLAEIEEINSSKLIYGLRFELSENVTEKEEIRSLYTEKITELEVKIINFKEENKSIKNDIDCLLNNKKSMQEELRLSKEADINSKSELSKLRISLESSEQLISNQTTELELLNEKKTLAKKEETNSSKLISGLRYELSENVAEKEEIRSLYTDKIGELEDKLNVLKEENTCLNNDLVTMSNNDKSMQEDIRLFVDQELMSKSELLQHKISLESSEKVIVNETTKIEILQQEIKNNKDCLTHMDSLRSQLEKTRKKLADLKIKRIKKDVDSNTINDLTITLETYKEKVSILEKKVDNIKDIENLQTAKSVENLQLVDIKEQLNKERKTSESALTEKKELDGKFDKIKYELENVERKSEERRLFDEDTINNLKEKIKLKDEEIKILNDKVEKYWTQKVENLNHRINLKSELLASKTDSLDNIDDNEQMVMPCSSTNDPLNQNKFLELNEKLAENEDFIKSLTTILNAKDEEITKLKLKVINNDDSDITASIGKFTQVRSLFLIIIFFMNPAI